MNVRALHNAGQLTEIFSQTHPALLRKWACLSKVFNAVAEHRRREFLQLMRESWGDVATAAMMAKMKGETVECGRM
jgi:hypothetical protein